MRAHRSDVRARRWGALLVALALAALAGGCGQEGRADSAPATDAVARRSPAAATSEPDPDALALVITDEGLAGVPVGTSTPRWVVPGAVAAPDGSAAFTVRNVGAGPEGAEGDGFEVQRIDLRTGAEEPVGRHVPGPPGIRVAAVEPGGERLALVAPGEAPDSTLVLDFDPARGGGDFKPTFEGQVEPEAFSLDRLRLFAARIYEDRYHVHVLHLTTGVQEPTLGPDKALPPEDMTGAVVQAVLSPDGTQLATLYRDDSTPDHTAFVHLLRLDDGSTVCIDLHAPFGTGAPGTDAITWREDGTVAVGHTAKDPAASMTATFDPAAIWGAPPQPHYHAEAAPDPDAPALPTGVAATPGFQRFVALAR